MDKFNFENEQKFGEYIYNNYLFYEIFCNYNIKNIYPEFNFKDSQKRIDYLIECDNTIILCEFKKELHPKYLGQIMQYKLLANNEFSNKNILSFLFCIEESSFENTTLSIDMIDYFRLGNFGFYIYENDKIFLYKDKIILKDFNSINNIVEDDDRDILNVKSMFNNAHNLNKYYKKYMIEEPVNILPLSSPKRNRKIKVILK